MNLDSMDQREQMNQREYHSHRTLETLYVSPVDDDDKKPSYQAYLLGSVWIDSVATNHPVWMVYATSPGAEKPVRASIQVGGTMRRGGSWSQDIKWPTNRTQAVLKTPRLERMEIRDGSGELDHVQTIAYYPSICDPAPTIPYMTGDEEGSSKDRHEFTTFAIIPPLDTMRYNDSRDEIRLVDAALTHFERSEGDGIKPYWDSYSQLLLLYLSSRISAPILTTRLARYLFLAAAVRLETVQWYVPYGIECKHRVTRRSTDTDDLKMIGYAPPLIFRGGNQTIDQICRAVPMMISRAYGTDALTSDAVPDQFLTMDHYTAIDLINETLEAIRNG